MGRSATASRRGNEDQTNAVSSWGFKSFILIRLSGELEIRRRSVSPGNVEELDKSDISRRGLTSRWGGLAESGMDSRHVLALTEIGWIAAWQPEKK